MIKVTVVKDDTRIERLAQIVSDGPPGTIRMHWAITADDQPRIWLLVKESRDEITGAITYSGMEQQPARA